MAFSLYNSKTKEYRPLKDDDPALKELKEKGYKTNSGWMGWTGSKWQLFATEEEYHEWCSEQK